MVKKVLAFSLIELMVVVAIVAITTAVAVPAYIQYQNKVKVSKAIPWVQDLMINNLVKPFEASRTMTALPSSITYGGQTMYATLAANSWISPSAIESGNSIYRISYAVSPTAGVTAFIAVVLITGLKNVPSYLDPAAGNTFLSNNAILFAGAMKNGTWRYTCGTDPNYFGGRQWLDSSVIPAMCRCSLVYTNVYLNADFTGC